MNADEWGRYEVEWWAWPAGARIASRGVVEIPARDEEDAVRAALARWPSIHVERVTRIDVMRR